VTGLAFAHIVHIASRGGGKEVGSQRVLVGNMASVEPETPKASKRWGMWR